MKSNHPWLRHIVASPAVRAVVEQLRHSDEITARGVWGSSANLLAGALAVQTQQPVLLVVAHLDEADDALEDLALLEAAGYALQRDRLSALEVLPGETHASLELLAERLAVVERLVISKNNDPQVIIKSAAPSPLPSPGGRGNQTNTPVGNAFSEIRRLQQRFVPLNPQFDILIAPIQALMQPVPVPEALGDFSIVLEAGKRYAPGQLLEWLDRAGYQRVDAIEQPGDFTTRGGIVDVYLPSSANAQAMESARGSTSNHSSVNHDNALTSTGPLPVRIDYFGDEIDSLSIIDTDTMGSSTRLQRVQLIGASLMQLQSDDRTTSLLELLPADTLIVLHEILEISEQARGYYERLTNPRGIIAPNTLLARLTQRKHVHFTQYGNTADGATLIDLPVRPLPVFAQEAAPAVKELATLVDGVDTQSPSSGHQVVVLCQKEGEQTRLRELLIEHAGKQSKNIALELGYLHRGFVWAEAAPLADDLTSTADEPTRHNTIDHSPDHGLYLIPHHELFHRYQTRRRIRRISTATASPGSDSGSRPSDAFLDINPGDYVVHVDHGIARFVEMRTLRRSGVTEDYLTLEFAGNATLHVPATQLDLIQKYVGGFEGKPPLSTLGGKRWARQKEEVSQAVQDMAAELLRVQAARASLPGVKYPADTAWQKAFEAEFPYEETDDQLAAIVGVKKDMSDEQPMDRLICGDVGFGKTEVAIRAAFKAMEFGKQVAVLVPTTVLAEQHERTFRSRMAEYPFRLASLSRFKTGAQQTQIVAGLARGGIDLVIGTHRLLSDDIAFHDLGLVIIDEEQRFGVEHKNKLLQLRLTADVLTLSATPIPRTLHMALLGLRDISSLSTPPADRRAIVTEVLPYDRKRVQQAILRELNRDGQIYFVHNRISSLQTLADELHKLAPDARIVIGHGQMAGHELEEVMLKFMRRQADILVSTTIIESGIDIPTANTMFIHDADHYGLAELHQLRGRVGRWKHRAYCYLLLPEDRPVTEKAAKRLKAIEQYAMLGAGFKIAMRDLEIRGAGNILGKQQSGHIAAVGYEMYCRLLEDQARNLRHEKIIEPSRTTLELPIAGRIPKTYLPSDKHRMAMYRRFSRTATLTELDALVADMLNAYGEAPEPVQRLIDLAELRIAAGTLGVKVVKLEPPDVIFSTDHPQKLDALLCDAPGRATLVDEKTVYYRPPANYLEPATTLLAVLRKLLIRPLRQADTSSHSG